MSSVAAWRILARTRAFSKLLCLISLALVVTVHCTNIASDDCPAYSPDCAGWLLYAIDEGAQLVVGGQNGVALYSRDGASWTGITGIDSTHDFNAIQWTGTAWILAGHDPSNQLAVYRSTDGISWNFIDITAACEGAAPFVVRGIARSAASGRIVIAANAGGTQACFVASDDDGLSWSQTAVNGTAAPSSIVHDASFFLYSEASGTGPQVWRSIDATSWALAPSPTPMGTTAGLQIRKMYTPVGTGEIYVSGSGTGATLAVTRYSSDSGASWLNNGPNVMAGSNTDFANAITRGNGGLVALAGNCRADYTSAVTAQTWLGSVPATTMTGCTGAVNWNSAVHHLGAFYGVGGTGEIATSTSGLPTEWSIATGVASQALIVIRARK